MQAPAYKEIKIYLYTNNPYLFCLCVWRVGMSNGRNADRLDWQSCHDAKR